MPVRNETVRGAASLGRVNLRARGADPTRAGVGRRLIPGVAGSRDMIERALLYTAEVAVSVLGRAWRRTAPIRGVVLETREIAARAYVEFLDSPDEASDERTSW